MTLLEMLSHAVDSRSHYGFRHEISDVLMMCIMSIMSGHCGYREPGCFVKTHSREFQQTFRLLHKVPSHVAIRSILQQIDFDSFNDAFNQWVLQHVPMCKGE